MDIVEYLAAFGLRGDFGRFRPVRPLSCRRGDRVVLRTARGLEVGEVLREATERHASFLPNTSVGALLRHATAEDERKDQDARQRAAGVYDRGKALAAELNLPLALLDAEVLLDEQTAVLYQLRWADCDVRPLVSTLSREFDTQMILTELAEPVAEDSGCGKCGSGGCGSCGSGGGCGSCGLQAEEVRAYFSGLRQQMEHRRPLL